MGWKESPPVFTSATETVAELANNRIQQGTKQLPHILELQAESCDNATTSLGVVKKATPTSKMGWAHGHAQKPVGKWDVYVDDFVGLAQGTAGSASSARCYTS
jgi:hypothetical protein